MKDISDFVECYKKYGDFAETFDYLTERFKKEIIKGGLPLLVLTDSISGEIFGTNLRGITTEEYGFGFLKGFFKKVMIA